MLTQFNAFLEAQQNKAQVDPNIHGPGGLFGAVGGEREVINTMLTPNGLASILPAVGTTTMYPLYPYVSGATDAGAQVAGSCNDAPAAGNLLSAYQTAQFGVTQFRTRELDITTVGQTVNPGEALDLRISDSALALAIGQIWLNIPDRSQAMAYGREILARFADVGRAFQQYTSRQTYVGSGAGVEFLGLEGIVKVNHLDAHTGLAVTSLDSDVRDFANVDILTQAGGASIVATVMDMYRNLKNNSTRMGFGATSFVAVMRPQMFTDLTDVWPCQMATYRCDSPNASTNINIQTDQNLVAAQEMRAGKFLWVDGDKLPVVVDDFLTETNVGGVPVVYSSDIYVLPMRTGDGRSRFYWEYFDYDAGMTTAIADGNLGNHFSTDRGIYAAVQNPVANWCLTYQFKNQLRLRLETPQLAGRIFDVGASHASLYRSSNASDAGYISSGAAGISPPSYTAP